LCAQYPPQTQSASCRSFSQPSSLQSPYSSFFPLFARLDFPETLRCSSMHTDSAIVSTPPTLIWSDQCWNFSSAVSGRNVPVFGSCDWQKVPFLLAFLSDLQFSPQWVSPIVFYSNTTDPLLEIPITTAGRFSIRIDWCLTIRRWIARSSWRGVAKWSRRERLEVLFYIFG
jgi:hypothetical protein